MAENELEKALKDLHLSVRLYLVCVTEIDPRNGAIATNTAYGPYKDYNSAIDVMRKMYEQALKSRDLEDNNACDEDSGETIPGGYFNSDEAGIYVYVDFAFGQLLEVVSYTIKGIDIQPDVQEYINERAEEYKAAHTEIAGPNSDEYAKRVKLFAEENEAMQTLHPEWTSKEREIAAEKLWKKINGNTN